MPDGSKKTHKYRTSPCSCQAGSGTRGIKSSCRSLFQPRLGRSFPPGRGRSQGTGGEARAGPGPAGPPGSGGDAGPALPRPCSSARPRRPGWGGADLESREPARGWELPEPGPGAEGPRHGRPRGLRPGRDRAGLSRDELIHTSPSPHDKFNIRYLNFSFVSQKKTSNAITI